MSPTALIISTVIGAYLIGGIPFGYLIGRMNGIDIRDHGSGNIGATNVLRTLGKKWGLTCFGLDFCKGLLPVLAARFLAAGYALARSQTEIDPLTGAEVILQHLPLLVVFATVAGHIWTPFLRFRGGKGIATSAGAVMGVAPIAVGCALLIWGVTLAIFRMVGLSSVLAAGALPIVAFLYGSDLPVVILLAVLGTLAIIRHRANIRRIIAGTEPKIGQKKEEPDTHEASSTQ